MLRRKLVARWAVCLALTTGASVRWSAPARANGDVAGPDAAAAAVQADEVSVRLGQRLRCPVCQGMAIGDSPSPMAQDMMRQVRRMRAAGRSEADIERYFTDRYGTWVLLDPPKSGISLWVWVLPPVTLVAGVGVALARVRRRRRPTTPPAAAAPGGVAAHLRAIYEEAEP